MCSAPGSYGLVYQNGIRPSDATVYLLVFLVRRKHCFRTPEDHWRPSGGQRLCHRSPWLAFASAVALSILPARAVSRSIVAC